MDNIAGLLNLQGYELNIAVLFETCPRSLFKSMQCMSKVIPASLKTGS